MKNADRRTFRFPEHDLVAAAKDFQFLGVEVKLLG
jgi:hypothetical protein